MVNGHPNPIRMCLYRNLVVITTVLVRSAWASTHFVTYLVATKMYWLLDYFLACLIGPMKSNPHFLNGFSSNVVTNLAKFWVNRLPIL